MHIITVLLSSDAWQQTKFSTIILSYAILIYQQIITVLVPRVTNTNIFQTTSTQHQEKWLQKLIKKLSLKENTLMFDQILCTVS